jgi:hypothetical protein
VTDHQTPLMTRTRSLEPPALKTGASGGHSDGSDAAAAEPLVADAADVTDEWDDAESIGEASHSFVPKHSRPTITAPFPPRPRVCIGCALYTGTLF